MRCKYIPIQPLRLNPSSEAKLQVHYKRSVHSTTDPYKRAVHCLLARCCVSDNHSEVVTKTDDYMWLKVSLGGSEAMY